MPVATYGGQYNQPYNSTYGSTYNSSANNQNTAAQQNPADSNPWGVGTAMQPNGNSAGQATQYQPSQMSPWQQPTPTPQPWQQGQQAQSQSAWAAPNGWTPASFATPTQQSQNTAYMSATLPYMQYMQNSYQYGQDFNEAQRRWNMQNQWQQQMDQYNMGLTGRQQQFNEWQANEAANQWGAQFGWQQQNDLFSQGLANRQLEVERAYNEGRLSNEQRQLALAELTQQQQNAYQHAQLAQQLGWNREELAATNAYRQQQDALARWQQQQQMQMQMRSLEAERANAVLQATGRAQGSGPNVQWMRRF